MINRAISREQIASMKRAFDSDRRFNIASNAICANPVTDVILKRDCAIQNKIQVFKYKMKYKEAKITDQKSTVSKRFVKVLN
jgi:aminopeptidase C